MVLGYTMSQKAVRTSEEDPCSLMMTPRMANLKTHASRVQTVEFILADQVINRHSSRYSHV